MYKSINKNFSLYLIILFCFGVFFLNEKHIVENDSTISEWLINYSGGFTKRGLVGHICVFFANFFPNDPVPPEIRIVLLLII